MLAYLVLRDWLFRSLLCLYLTLWNLGGSGDDFFPFPDHPTTPFPSLATVRSRYWALDWRSSRASFDFSYFEKQHKGRSLETGPVCIWNPGSVFLWRCPSSAGTACTCACCLWGLSVGWWRVASLVLKVEKFSSAVAEMGVSVQSSALVLGVLGAGPSPTC